MKALLVTVFVLGSCTSIRHRYSDVFQYSSDGGIKMIIDPSKPIILSSLLTFFIFLLALYIRMVLNIKASFHFVLPPIKVGEEQEKEKEEENQLVGSPSLCSRYEHYLSDESG
uniref:Uncharacterized protein n=1 Tax=Caenorhabditis japonica TaxID=281687 RepID=A0A8R1INN7_CAEJA